jgi:hypothetical protein
MCQNCLPLDLTGIGQIGPAGSTGAAGSDGSDGTKILVSDTTAYTTATNTSWESTAFSYTLPINTLASDGDEIDFVVFGTGGDSTPASYDQMAFVFNGAPLVNPDAYYRGALSCSYYFPYSTTAAAEFKLKVKRLSATSVRIFMYKTAQGGNSRVDLYATSTSCNNLTSATNSFGLNLYSGSVTGSVDIYNTTISLNKT